MAEELMEPKLESIQRVLSAEWRTPFYRKDTKIALFSIMPSDDLRRQQLRIG